MVEKQNLRLLVVDDEKAIRIFLKTSLNSYGYSVFEATCGKEALVKAVEDHPDVVILDLGLPDIDGLEVIKQIRKRSKTPIIILSVRDEAAEKIMALDAGADDYLVKPFLIGELLARLRAVLRRLLPLNKTEIIKTGKLSVDVTKHRVLLGKKEISLPPTEYELLKLFIINSGKVLTHKQILREIWDKTEDYEGVLHLLRVTISNLRNRTEPNPDRPIYILTEPGVGYRLKVQD
jgi:two-component system KDP operon response regulator KdpE